MQQNLETKKAEILKLVREYSELAHLENRPGWDPQKVDTNSIPYGGRVFDCDEVEAAVSSTLDFWLTLGKEGKAFESELSKFLNISFSVLTNSGSSANLLAISALTSPQLPSDKRLLPGDEVISCAAGFPTTVAPIVQNQCIPVLLDNDPITGNADLSLLEEAYQPGKTKALILAHTLGNPFDISSALSFCQKHDLWLIEDNCDALGSAYTSSNNSTTDPKTQYTGSWGDISTQSFYPPHHMTLGEGGAVNIARSPRLRKLVESFRDWGRDCWCPSGCDDTCGKRFDWQRGDLPPGYDHKYIYSHFGYNLKPLDPQAAIGLAQLKKLPRFIEERKRNWNFLRSALDKLQNFFEFALPTHATHWKNDGFEWDNSGNRSDCSWFGFMLMVKKEAPFTKVEFANHLESKGIQNRMLFGGNLTKQPAFMDLLKHNPDAFRVVGGTRGADRLMNEAVFIGVYPGLSEKQLTIMAETIHTYCASF
ncbi:lipopolysaccharide biosynthesis protein RfbH [Pelagicoccus sp. SDUM812005]|uniref:lipopolysaccharide biosynthesis protein RfbH n=1 Tax=Pelagicoccus sp. SDUM812005 TaxID=3041257 RepID=UPI00280ED4CE|nr:lipopolysaccharide biosynthesis protein RfbH [Pelagicoccus sp. SDUM812005]MDQ8180934.1 lipopolysaccharide biosynthesis protein RfbH [Pelagicoccus sp. SDUM812005]